MHNTLESAHPDASRKQEVIERSVDGLEECTEVALALSVGQLRACVVQARVHPYVVARHRADVLDQLAVSPFGLVTMFYLQKVLGTLVLPPASLIILLGIGLLMIRRWPRAGQATAWTATLALLLLSLPVTSMMLVHAATSVAPFSAETANGAQAVVILGGGRRYAPEYGGETVAPLTLQRLRYGAKLAEELELPVLVTGGSVHGHGAPEAHLMAETLERSFSTSVKWIESRSRNTHENALFSARLLRDAGIDKVILVTHDIHQRRSMAEFSAVDIQAIPASVTLSPNLSGRTFPEHLPSAQWLMLSSLALHELLGYLVLAPKP